MTPLDEDAWIVNEYVKGRMQTKIAAELGTSSAIICASVARFCETHGFRVVHQHWGSDRVEIARDALHCYLREGGKLTRPGPYVGVDHTYAHARREHVWLLRAEGLTLEQIAARIGLVSRERVRQIIHQFGRRVQRAMRKTRFKWKAAA
jgi:hypothetical protein